MDKAKDQISKLLKKRNENINDYNIITNNNTLEIHHFYGNYIVLYLDDFDVDKDIISQSKKWKNYKTYKLNILLSTNIKSIHLIE